MVHTKKKKNLKKYLLGYGQRRENSKNFQSPEITNNHWSNATRGNSVSDFPLEVVRSWLVNFLWKGLIWCTWAVSLINCFAPVHSKYRNGLKPWISLILIISESITPWWLLVNHSIMSNSLWPHDPQHPRPPCPSPSPGACSNSCPSNGWCHPAISSSVVPFSSCLQSFPASGCFLMNQFFASGDQSIGVSASASVLPMNVQDWFPFR